MAKTDFLLELKKDDLKEIAQKEGLKTVPKNYEKEDFIKFLEGVLTAEKIKKYREEYYEKETVRDIHIHEKVKERGFRTETEETSKISMNRHEAIVNLQKERISKKVLEEIANFLHEPLPSGSGVKLYDNMNEKMLNVVREIFFDNKEDKTGRYFEFRCANWLDYNEKGLSRLEVRHKFPKIGEIDIVGFDQQDEPILMAECKDRTVSFEDVDKWIANMEKLVQEYPNLSKAYFFSSKGYSQGVVDRVRNNANVNQSTGDYTLKRGILSKAYVKLKIYDNRGDKFLKQFP
jgi:Holliday junction resolvase-like predicted endonuclease